MPIYIEAPTVVEELTDNGIFLAGGITDCVDWQKIAKNVLMSNDKYDWIANPRRENFDIFDNSVSEEQIKWEAEYLDKCSEIMFWFSNETIQPITLFELGICFMKKSIIYIGCDPNYSRKLDVEIQANIYRPDIKIWNNLDDMLDHIIDVL